MTLSTRLGLLPQQLMEQVSWRWYRTWLQWELDKWPKLGPIDCVTSDPTLYYLSRIAQRIQQVLADNPNKYTLENQYVLFEEKKIPVSKEEAARQSKALWVGMLGGKAKIKYRKKRKGA